MANPVYVSFDLPFRPQNPGQINMKIKDISEAKWNMNRQNYTHSFSHSLLGLPGTTTNVHYLYSNQIPLSALKGLVDRRIPFPSPLCVVKYKRQKNRVKPTRLFSRFLCWWEASQHAPGCSSCSTHSGWGKATRGRTTPSIGQAAHRRKPPELFTESRRHTESKRRNPTLC